MYEKCKALAPYNLLSDAGFSSGDGGLLQTTTRFLDEIDYDYKNQYGLASANEFVQLRQAAEWAMKTLETCQAFDFDHRQESTKIISISQPNKHILMASKMTKEYVYTQTLCFHAFKLTFFDFFNCFKNIKVKSSKRRKRNMKLNGMNIQMTFIPEKPF